MNLVEHFSKEISKLTESPYALNFVHSTYILKDIEKVIISYPSEKNECIFFSAKMLDEISQALRQNRSAHLGKYDGPRKYIYLERYMLEDTISTYLESRYRMPSIEMTFIKCLLGHEYESFLMYRDTMPEPGFLSLITGYIKEYKERISQLSTLSRIYEIINGDSVNLDYLKQLADLAIKKDCYIHPKAYSLLSSLISGGAVNEIIMKD